MPSAPIYFGNDQRSGDQQLAGASPLAINVVTDGAGAVRRRPGISAWSGMPAGTPALEVQGIYDFEGALYVVYSDRRIFRFEGGVATDLSTAGAASRLAGSGRPVFAETAFRLAIAGGRHPQKVDSGENVAERLGGSPPDSTHIVAISQRLVSNDLTDASTDDRVRFSNTGNAGNEVWDALGFVTAEARPDGLVSLNASTNQVFAFGRRTLQVFQPVGDDVRFAPLVTLQRGCAAAHGVIQVDEEFAWLTEKRAFVLSDGRSVQEMSTPISQTLDEASTVSDAYGFRWHADQFDVLCWLFPTDERVWALQQGGGWAQWFGWTPNQGHTVFPITAHHFWPEENLHLVGMADGTVAKLDSAAYSDLGDTIKAEVLTGFINRDTDAHKHCQAVRFVFRRGHASGTAPQVMLSWRDHLGAFCPPIRMDLGVVGDHVFTVEKRSLGVYRARQWKLEFTDAVDFVLARAEETYTIGGQN